MPVLSSRRLTRISQATHATIDQWNEAVSLTTASGQPIPQLLQKVAADRWRFAYQQRTHANRLFNQTPGLYRGSISRYYYSMYHAMRACVFIKHPGDDFQSHSELPLHIPNDFDPPTDWEAKLKAARFARNRADYESYPKANSAWRKTAEDIRADANQLLVTARLYLQGKGCIL